MRAADAYRPPSFGARIEIDLSRNETYSFDGIEQVLARLHPDDLVSYPDTSSLREAIAARHELKPDRVAVTAGGDDGLARCFLANAGRRVVSTKPSFEMIRRYASQVRADLVEIPWWSGNFPLGEFAKATESADLAIIVSPNNPTGSTISPPELETAAANAALLVLDAAYVEFADEDPTTTALELGNVVVIRTLSKVFGLAGLRVGYLLGPAEAIDAISSYGSPYSVSSVSARIADEAVRSADLIPARVEPLNKRRALLAEALTALGIDHLPSQANFILAVDDRAEWLVNAAAAMGIALRFFADSDGLERCFRITVPASDETLERLVETLAIAVEPEALIFDLDGVIADVSGSYRQAIVETGASFGVDIRAEDILAAKAAGNANDDWELTHRLLATKGVELDLEAVIERFESIYQGTAGRPGLRESEKPLVDHGLLKRWSKTRPLGIVTGRPRSDARAFLQRFDLAGFFDTVVTIEDAPGKPDPAPVRLAMERLGVTRAWMAGDTRDDLDAARGAGALPIGVIAVGDEPDSARRMLSPAAAVLDNINDLEELLE